jgi:hypothetical protein
MLIHEAAGFVEDSFMGWQLTIQPILLFGKSEPSILHASVAVLRWKIIRLIGELTAIASILSVLV